MLGLGLHGLLSSHCRYFTEGSKLQVFDSGPGCLFVLEKEEPISDRLDLLVVDGGLRWGPHHAARSDWRGLLGVQSFLLDPVYIVPIVPRLRNDVAGGQLYHSLLPWLSILFAVSFLVLVAFAAFLVL